MNDFVWKAAVTILLILGCAALALRAGKTHAVPGRNAPNAAAAPNSQFGLDTQCVSTVPRAWGQYRGGSSQAGLAFEANDGTLRFVTNLPCGATPVIALEVRRTPAGGNSPN
jgi:hypothetical protein